MPKWVEHTVEARTVRKGDMLIWRNRQWTIEEKADTKTKFSYIKVEESQETFRIESLRRVTVLRSEPTAKENLAVMILKTAESVRSHLANTEIQWETAKALFMNRLDSEYLLTSSEAQRLYEAQEEYKLRHKLINVLCYKLELKFEDEMESSAKLERLLEATSDDNLVVESLEVHLELVHEAVWRRSGRYNQLLPQAFQELEWEVGSSYYDSWSSYTDMIDHYRAKVREEELEALKAKLA